MRIADDEFIGAWKRSGGSPAVVSEMLGLSVRSVYKRRGNLAKKGIILETNPLTVASGPYNTGWRDVGRAYRRVNNWNVDSGTVVIFSDAHWWPDQPKSVAHQALLEVIRAVKPIGVIANGDLFDGARISRHAPLGWSALPTVKQEMEICDEYLHEIHQASDPRRSSFFWNVGNHDQRFDRMLVQNASEYEGVIPRLEDKFPRWEFGMSIDINGHTMVKHRYHNGIHAGFNNAVKSGRSIVTGHLHRLLVTPWADYNGRRWGVDTGTLADTLSPQFDYAENNPSPHTSGFAVLTFLNGRLLPPELVECIDGHAYFRGELVI